MTATYRLHGLRVRSEIPLHERLRPFEEDEGADVRILLDHAAPSAGDPDGVVVAESKARGSVLYRIFRLPSGGYLLRAYGVSDFDISADLGVIRCRPEPAVDRRWLSILLRGTVIAVLLDLRGRPTLHASAVAIDGRAIAFAGASGAGKTTTAALFCAAGARLVADDVLTVETADAGPSSLVGPSCPVGSSELRLRDGAAALLDEPNWVVGRRLLVDGRWAVRVQEPDDPAGPLMAVVFPSPSRSADRPSIRRVRPAEAIFRLASVARISTWTSPDIVEQAFSFTTDLAAVVPVFDAEIPAGPPWRPASVLPMFDAVAGALV